MAGVGWVAWGRGGRGGEHLRSKARKQKRTRARLGSGSPQGSTTQPLSQEAQVQGKREGKRCRFGDSKLCAGYPDR